MSGRLTSRPGRLSTVERAKLAARKRWGPPRVVRLDDLSPEAQRLILALLEAARADPGEVSEPDGMGALSQASPARARGRPTSIPKAERDDAA